MSFGVHYRQTSHPLVLTGKRVLTCGWIEIGKPEKDMGNFHTKISLLWYELLPTMAQHLIWEITCAFEVNSIMPINYYMNSKPHCCHVDVSCIKN